MSSRLKRFLRRHRDEERGAVLIVTCVSMIMLLGAGALGVDVGFTVYGSRSAQAMADTAALDLVQDIPTIDSQTSPTNVQTYITTQLGNVDTDNGSNAVLTATPGLWFNNTWKDGVTAFGSNGCAGTVFFSVPSACNAIKVTASQSAPQLFWGGSTAPSRTAIAVLGPDGGFSIGSYLASINTQQSNVLNALLSELGASANVTAVGYQGMANTYLSLSNLITASNGVLTPSNVMTALLTGQQWLTIFGNAVGNQVAQLSCGSSPTPLPCNAQTGLSALNFNSSTSAQLCQMFSVNGSTCANGNVSTSALNTDLDLLQTLTTEAELANGTNALDVKSALGITGVTAAKLTLTLGQIPQAAYGPVGSYTSGASPCPAPSGQTSTCAVTAQVSSDLNLTVLNVVGSPVTVDIPLSAAVGYATLYSITCSDNMFQNMQILVSTTLASGTVTMNGSTLSTLSINGVTNRTGTYTVVPPNATTATNTSPPQNPQTFGSKTPALHWSPAITGIDANVAFLLNTTLASVLGPILQVTGADVGGAQVAATSAGCDAINLVQ